MLHKSASRLLSYLALLFAQLASPVIAETSIGLQISGAVQAVNLSLEDLDAMPQVSFETSTIWTDEAVVFSGVSLKALLTQLGAKGETLEMVALNDYAVQMPIAEIEDGAPIIATRMNANVMSVRDKGPYWVVFPYDRDPRYRTETMYARSIWQLNRLMVVN